MTLIVISILRFYKKIITAMRYLFFLFIIATLSFSCKKNKATPECAVPTIVPFQPYSDPVWHPNGQLLGFNHTPLVGIATNGTGPCIWYSYLQKADSTGFYLMNKDRTGFKRVTNFAISAPSWSPDGKWIAFSLGPNIYKMPFNGSTFDTTQIIQLTTTGGNFYPSWTANSDTIFFDSNVGTNGQGYYVWKMANDGSGKIGFPNTGREPHIASDGNVYFVKGVAGQPEIFSMAKDGSNQKQITFNGKNGLRRSPKYWQGKIFYQDIGLWFTSVNGSSIQLDFPCITYDISTNGEIIYSKMDYDITKYNKQIGTLWIMNADGSNNRQLTYNNF